jgi:sulfide:quinone oxidoreductase
MTTHVLVLGSGVGGSIVANGLCRRLSDELAAGKVRITVVGEAHKHLYQPGLLHMPFGGAREKDLFRDQRQLLDRRIEFVVDSAVKIDAAGQQVLTASNRRHAYDYLVIATGSRPVPETVPGLAEEAHSFYDLDGARRLRAALDGFSGGKIVVNVNVPHKCPVAPIEFTLLLDEYLRGRGLEGKFHMTYTYPIRRAHAIESVAEWAELEFRQRGIAFQNFFNTREVDAATRTIHSEESDSLPYDLLVTIPPHRGMAVIEDSGLGTNGWIPTNPRTLLKEDSDNIFVIGDTAGIPIAKAGSTAHYEANVVIDNLSMLIQEGRWARSYDGKVFCFVETGRGNGGYLSFDYETPPTMAPPTEMVHWFKRVYKRLYWLSIVGLM